MAHHVTRITTLIGSAVFSAMALAAPQPFDGDIAAELAANPSFTLPEDEEVALHYIASCAALAPPQRLCRELPLNLNGDTRGPGGTPIVDMIIGANGAGGVKRFYSGRSDGLFNPAEYFGGEGPTSGLKIADLDNDGDLDMVETMRGEGTPDTGTNIVYVNRHGTLRSLFDDEQALDGAKNDRSSGVVIGDVNGDNKLDVVISNETTGGHDVASPNQTNYLYLNTTTQPNNVTFGPAIRLDAVGTEKYTRRMLLIDVEGDGDLDIVATAANTSADNAGVGNLLYVNTGGAPDPMDNPFAAAVPLNASTADDTDVANAIAAGDIDGDGVADDLVFSTWSSQGSGEAMNRYYINNSTVGSINFETTGTFGTADNHTNVRLADFDNDTRPDLITVVVDGRNVLHRNTGAPPYFGAGFQLEDPFSLAAGRYASRGVDFADLNGDGSQDLVIANRALLGLRYLNNDQCAPGSCLGGHDGPFDNFGPTIVSQNSSAVVPPGGAPINIDRELLGNLDVNDTDNVYPTDFTAFPERPSGTEYTCTDGIIVSSGVCATSQITPGPGAADGHISVSLKIFDSQDYSGAFHYLDLTIGTGSAPAFTTSATLPPATEDAAYTTTITASDNDGNVPLVFAPVDLLPTWLQLVAATGTTATLSSTTPPVQGNVANPASIAIRVTDSGGLSTTQTFTLAVTNVNDKPSVTTTTLPNGTQGQPYTATVTASDEDGTIPTFATPNTSLPAGLVLGADGAISGTPTASGTFQVVLTATDGTLSSDPVTVPLTIAAAGNASPLLTAPSAQTAAVGTAFSLTVTATDADSDPLTFAATGLPTGFAISAAGVITGTATATTGSPFTVAVTVNDGRGGTDTETFQLTVQAPLPGNSAPVMTAPGPQSSTVGTAFSLTVTATDADSDPLTFAATGLPTGFAISAAGVITGTATATTGSPFTVAVTVNDGRGGTDTETFQLTVQAPLPGNSAPVMTAPGPQSGTVGVAFTLSLAGSASDADGDPVTFAATGLPPGITVSPAGLLSGSPTTAAGSPFAVTVTVNDGRGGTTSGTFQFTVSNPTSGGSGSSGGGSFGFLEVLGLLGMGALGARRRRAVSRMPQR